ncbi:MAG: hypothetical protein U0169_23470 [Polyangiaceae bacterium]
MSRATSPSAILLTVFALAIAGTSGCKPKAGGKCKVGNDACGDPSTSLVCVDGTYAEVPCRGPKGCNRSGGTIACDTSVATLGDGCAVEKDAACTADKASVLVCKDKKFTFASHCRGTKGCAVTGTNVSCDDTSALEGDPCTKEKDAACSVDKQSMLFCDGTRFKLESRCRGPKGCAVEDRNIRCDSTVGNLGDTCGTAEGHTCSGDKKQLLVCKAGKFKLASFCRGARGCAFEGADRVRCDATVANVDDPCEGDGSAACSEDKKSILKCKGEKFVTQRGCPKGCSVAGTSIVCR